MTKNCAYSGSLVEYINETLSKAQRLEIERHLETCESCQNDLGFWTTISDELQHEYEEISAPDDLFIQTLVKIRNDRGSGAILKRAFLLLKTQLRIIRQEIWLTSFLVTVLEVIAGMISGHGEIIQLLSPFVSAACLAQIYTPELDPAMEVEFASPTSPRQILLSRIVLSYGYNLLLAFTAHVCLYGFVQNAFIWEIILGWLGPMTFLSALALVLSMSFGMNMAIIISSSIWLFRILFSNYLGNIQEFFTDKVYGLILSINALWDEPGILLLLSLGLMAIAIIQVGRKNSTVLKNS